MSKHRETPHQEKAKLAIALPSGEHFILKMSQSEIRIGSGWRNDILLVDPGVSYNHTRLTFHNDRYVIIDEGSKGGTFVNDEKVTQPRKLSHGDVIRMGKSLITFMCKHKAAKTKLPAAAKAEEKEKNHPKHKKEKHKGKSVAVDSRVAAKASSNVIETEEEIKKKKDKQKAKGIVDERVKAAKVRAWGGIIATVMSVVLTVTISIIVTRMSGQQTGASGVTAGALVTKKLVGLSDSNKISGGRYEASGAVAVPDANGVLFVDDSKPDHVFYMPVNELGEQDGPIKALSLGVSVANPEGISQFGSRFMITGSLSTHESNDKGGIAIFDYDAASQTVSKAAVLTGMRKFLFDNVPELKSWANKTSLEGGLNVEGIAVDPNPEHPRVLLGLRGPVLNGNALIVPLKIRDRQAPLSVENLVMDEPNAIELNLKGQAIRDIQYDSRLRSFLIISGAPETAKKTDFALWEWNGEADQTNETARPKQQAVLDKNMKPEGVTHLKIADQEFVFIVGDASRYAKIEYLLP